MTSRVPPSLEEARAKLRELGYLHGRVERYVFRRALEGLPALLAPVLAAGTVGIALAFTAAVAATQFRFGGSARATALLSVHHLPPAVLVATAFALLLAAAAGVSRRPGAGAAAFGLAAAGGTVLLWLLGVWTLGAHGLRSLLLWAFSVAAAAALYGATARATFLARAFARSGRLPMRRPIAVIATTTMGMLALGAMMLALQREEPRPRPPLPSPRPQPVIVAAVDGLRLDEPGGSPEEIARALRSGATGWWPLRPASSPAEVWTDLATGVPASRHGVRALEWVRPAGIPPLRPAPGTGWYFRGPALALRIVARAPVSAWERRSLSFWEVAASAGLPSAAIGWWASGPWPGAEVVENRSVLARSGGGLEADAVAISEFARASRGRKLATVYLPGADILRDDPADRAAALARIGAFLERLAARARSGEIALVVLSAESHPTPRSLGRMIVFDDAAPSHTFRIQPEDVAPSILARAGVPAARDLTGRPVAGLFRPGAVETETVATYGERVVPPSARPRDTDREYLEKLKSLGYLD